MTSIEPAAADTSTSAEEKVFRRKAKKLRKLARSGTICTLEKALECSKYGIVVRAEADWGDELLQGRRPNLSPRDLRRAILHVLAGPTEVQCPSWLNLKNGGLISSVVVVGLAGVDPTYMKENLSQLPFLQSCTRPIELRFYKGNHPRRSVYSLLYYSKRKNDGQEGGEEENGHREREEEDDEEEEEEEEGGPSDSYVDDDATVSVDPAERYVLGLTQLRLGGFPIPPRGVSASEEGVGGRDRADTLDSSVGDSQHHYDDEDDLGCPVDEVGRVQHAFASNGKAVPAWLEGGGEGGTWGETKALIPSLDEAKRILSTLDAIKIGGVSCCFYETLGGRAEDEEPPYGMAALDCEMCQTNEGMEVTRLTLVDDKQQVLLESYVKPYNDIVNYHTKYSGITAEIMEGCGVRIEQVQVALLRLVRADTILVGHSLEQDMMVTGLIHLRCIDTALLYHHPRGPQCRFALRVLAKKYLNRVIQDSTAGHCSREDAIAALELVQIKVEHGPDFGVEGPRGEETKGRESFLDKLATCGKRCTLLDQSDTLVKVIRGQASAIVCRSNDETINKAKVQAKQTAPPHFMWASLYGTRPATLESIEVRRKRRLHAEATAAAGAASIYLPSWNNQLGSLLPATKRFKTENGSNGSSSNGTSSIITPIGKEGSTSSTMTTTMITTQQARHTKFTYEEHIMEMVDPELLKADQSLAELYESLPINTLMIVIAQPDVALSTHLYNQRIAALNSRTTLPWTKEQDEVLNQLCKEAQRGVVMMRVR